MIKVYRTATDSQGSKNHEVVKLVKARDVEAEGAFSLPQGDNYLIEGEVDKDASYRVHTYYASKGFLFDFTPDKEGLSFPKLKIYEMPLKDGTALVAPEKLPAGYDPDQD